MSEENKIKFLSPREAANLVGAIQEEEDIHRPDRRIFTVYSTDNRELCWFDYQETMEAVGDVEKSQVKEAVQNYILHHIPEWVLED